MPLTRDRLAPDKAGLPDRLSRVLLFKSGPEQDLESMADLHPKTYVGPDDETAFRLICEQLSQKFRSRTPIDSYPDDVIKEINRFRQEIAEGEFTRMVKRRQEHSAWFYDFNVGIRDPWNRVESLMRDVNDLRITPAEMLERIANDSLRLVSIDLVSLVWDWFEDAIQAYRNFKPDAPIIRFWTEEQDAVLNAIEAVSPGNLSARKFLEIIDGGPAESFDEIAEGVRKGFTRLVGRLSLVTPAALGIPQPESPLSEPGLITKEECSAVRDAALNCLAGYASVWFAIHVHKPDADRLKVLSEAMADAAAKWERVWTQAANEWFHETVPDPSRRFGGLLSPSQWSGQLCMHARRVLDDAIRVVGLLSDPSAEVSVRDAAMRLGLSCGELCPAGITEADIQEEYLSAVRSLPEVADNSPGAAPGSDPKPDGVFDASEQSRVHSANFTSVKWDGVEFVFTTNQANCIRVLWQALESGATTLSGVEVLERAGVNRSDDRLDQVFRSQAGLHPAWKVMVESPQKGKYRLYGKTHGKAHR